MAVPERVTAVRAICRARQQEQVEQHAESLFARWSTVRSDPTRGSIWLGHVPPRAPDRADPGDPAPLGRPAETRRGLIAVL